MDNAEFQEMTLNALKDIYDNLGALVVAKQETIYPCKLANRQ